MKYPGQSRSSSEHPWKRGYYPVCSPYRENRIQVDLSARIKIMILKVRSKNKEVLMKNQQAENDFACDLIKCFRGSSKKMEASKC
jgi:hypothetical protein